MVPLSQVISEKKSRWTVDIITCKPVIGSVTLIRQSSAVMERGSIE